MSLNGPVVGPVAVAARANQCAALSGELVVCLIMLRPCASMVEGFLPQYINPYPKLVLSRSFVFNESLEGLFWGLTMLRYIRVVYIPTCTSRVISHVADFFEPLKLVIVVVEVFTESQRLNRPPEQSICGAPYINKKCMQVDYLWYQIDLVISYYAGMAPEIHICHPIGFRSRVVKKRSGSSTTTQNNGVTMKVITTFISRKSDLNAGENETMYYGVVKEILELDYFDFQQTKIRNICIAEPEIVSFDIDIDPITQVCGKDTKDRTRACGLNVSREEVISSYHLRDQLHQEKTARLTLEEDLVHDKDKLTTMDEKLSCLAAGRKATSGFATFNESCIENSRFEVLSVLHMMAILLFSEANSLHVSKNLMDASEKNVSEDCKKDFIDLLLKASGHLEFCVNQIVGHLPKEIKNTYDNTIFKKKKNKLNIEESVVFIPAMQIPVESNVQSAHTGLVPQDHINKLSSLRNQIVLIADDTDCKKDSIDLLLKASGYLKFCVNHIGTKMQLGLAIKSQTTTLSVKKRLACEQLSCFAQCYMDSRCSFQMTGDESNISNLEDLLGGDVTLGDSSITSMVGKGNVKGLGSPGVENVLLV
ncbi:hypothetical protein GIB67_035097 [Kingdonia uniflora]|uniref:Uncharacterized protein n=1 Tax=Kingdonia uniflora TaxID=39325 RepID=A0A7J7MCD8_9MAGN|nr:hypothetical protein GIB67_035097 [Kingdonia uniflora]